MNEEDIRLLLTLQRTRNITKTSELMNLTQPALTRRVQVLEADLGTRLLIRSRNGVIFTPEGENILPKIKELEEGFASIREYLNVHAGKISGKLKLGASGNYAQFGMAKVVADFTRRYPDVKLQIESAQSWHVYKRLLNKDISLAILRGEYKWDDIHIRFSQEPVYVIADKPCSLEDLNHMLYIRRNMESGLKKSVSQWFDENGIHPRSQLDIDNIKFAISPLDTLSRSAGRRGCSRRPLFVYLEEVSLRPQRG